MIELGPGGGSCPADGPVQSLRTSVERWGANLREGMDLGQQDPATQFVAMAIAHRGLDRPLPPDLLDVIDTFDDLAHFANTRLAQEGHPPRWSA